jgi:hypothetical protein
MIEYPNQNGHHDFLYAKWRLTKVDYSNRDADGAREVESRRNAYFSDRYLLFRLMNAMPLVRNLTFTNLPL